MLTNENQEQTIEPQLTLPPMQSPTEAAMNNSLPENNNEVGFQLGGISG
jgi:hypothetical protein